MNSGRNRLIVALGTLGAVLLLLGAFTVVWLMPREPGIGNAGGQSNPPANTNEAPVAIGGDADLQSKPGVSMDAASVAKGNMAQTGVASAAPVLDQPHITVRGSGIVSAKPDIVNLQIGVQIQKDSLQDAQNEASTKINAAMQQLKSAGVEDKDISTAQYNVEPVMDHRDNEAPRVTGFRVTNILAVKIRAIGNAGKLIDSLVQSGANSVYGLSFGFSDPSALMKQAREAAMNDAKAKAGQLATLGGVTLGTPLVIDDGGANVPPPVMETMPAADMGQRAGAAPAITPGQQEIRVEVQVVYSIK